MELISSAKSTKLVSFDHLKPKFNYIHVENESRDFSFLGKKVIFEVNRSSGVEMLRVKTSPKNVNEILLVRKMKEENLYCLGCPKKALDFVSLGLCNGQIGLLNYKKHEYIAKFPAESANNGVIFLDFNASDEYMSAVYENGLINLYGLKTKTKLETINLDKQSTLAKFHPVKRFHLSVASYSGAVYIYDMNSKKRIFKSSDFHNAPCRDLCTSPSTPDVLLSVGYDNVLNIFDTRRKLSPLQVRGNHPLSSVCVSNCGRFCVTGNLKGELISYDLRNFKEMLQSNQVHDSAVIRVEYLANEESSFNVSNLDSTPSILCETQNLPPADENQGKVRRDSFFDFINTQSLRGRETMSRRDSFNLQGFERRNYDFDPRTSLDKRQSIDPKLSLDKRLNPVGKLSMDLKSINDILPDLADGESYRPSVGGSRFKMRRSSIECITSEKKFRGNLIDDFIEEEVFEDPPCAKKLSEKLQAIEIRIDLSDDENRSKENLFMKLSDDKKSTPNQPKRVSTLADERKSEEPIGNEQIKNILDEIKSIREEMKNSKEEMNNKIRTLESELKFHMDSVKSDFYMQNFNLWKNQMKVAEDTRTMLFGLLHADPFVEEFLKLQEENNELRKTINNLRKVR